MQQDETTHHYLVIEPKAKIGESENVLSLELVVQQVSESSPTGPPIGPPENFEFRFQGRQLIDLYHHLKKLYEP